jgi:hypothetical protein
VVAEQAQPWRHSTRTDTLDEVICTVEALADTSARGQRCVKSRRDGRADAAVLDAMESLPWLLETVFALHGRLRPYNTYLRWELETFPLPDDWNASLLPERLATGSLHLFPAVESLARRRGHADVLEGWGSDIDHIRAFAAPTGAG